MANLLADTNGDGRLNIGDQTALINHLNSKKPFWDKNQTSTMNLGEKIMKFKRLIILMFVLIHKHNHQHSKCECFNCKK